MRRDYKIFLLTSIAGFVLVALLVASPAFAGNTNADADALATSRSDSDSRSTSRSSAEGGAARANVSVGDSKSSAVARGGQGGRGGAASASSGDSSASTGDVTVTSGGTTFEDNSVYDAPDFERMPGTPAAVTVDSCSSGASISAPGYGASIAAGSRFCKLIALSNAYRFAGDEESADWALAEAREDVSREGRVVRFLHLDEIPLVGRLF